LSRVVVLGGGPAGLYVSLLLARRGLPVTLLEREPVPGGLTAGTEIDGIPVDFGSHRLHPSTEPGILDDLIGLLGDDLQMRPRHGRIHLAGTWVSFPISPSEMLTRLTPRTVARLGLGAAKAMVTPSRSASFADVVSTGLGDGMGDLFYFPYARKIWGVGPEELSGEQARRRISADSPWKLARRAFASSSPGRQFYYPRRGFGQIAAALADGARQAGAEVRLGSTVTTISGREGSYEVAHAGGTIPAGLVLSTIPITALARFFDPPDGVRQALDTLRYRGMVLVYLSVSTRQWTPFDAHYFPGADVAFTRISEPKNYRDGPDPDDHTVLCVEMPCDPGDAVWSADDGTLVEETRVQIVRLGLPDPGDRGQVRRIRHAYPIYRIGSENAFEVVASWLEGRRGIVTYGRQGLFAHDNTHHAMAMARAAAESVTDSLDFDYPAWSRARKRFARHVVED
jgi:protoporphyrinogen oxidase